MSKTNKDTKTGKKGANACERFLIIGREFKRTQKGIIENMLSKLERVYCK